jgi:crotonobetainyl-CoA:carnitine CoA-transferase CaiB-like acyl-CoA transferase
MLEASIVSDDPSEEVVGYASRVPRLGAASLCGASGAVGAAMLSGLRVLDLADESGFLAGKILGDLGADVVKIEPPGGDRGARRGPFLGQRGDAPPDPERSLVWLALNTSKRGITLNLGAPAGRELFERLLAGADVVLETFAPGWLESQHPELGWERLRALYPRLVWCAITPFGQSGPRARGGARDLVAVALGGNAWMTGDPERPPVRCSLPSAYYHAAPAAALGIALALRGRQRSGRGDFVDVSLQECQLETLLGGVGSARVLGRVPRRSGARTGRTREIWPARDGYVSFGLRGGPARVPGLVALVAWMDECGQAPDWLRGFDWERYDPERLEPAGLARLEEAFGAFFRSRSRRELYAGALERRILLAPCNDAREVLAQPQLRSRGFFVELEYPELGARIEHPAFFARTEDGAVRLRRRAPRIGEHNAEVYAELGLGPEAQAKLAAEGVL